MVLDDQNMIEHLNTFKGIINQLIKKRNEDI